MLARIIDRAAVGMVVSEMGGNIIYGNRAFSGLLGHKLDAATQLNILDIIHPDDRAAGRLQLRRLMRNETDEYRGEHRFCRADGTPLWVMVATSLLRDEATGRVRLARTIREREEIIDEPILRDEVSVRRVPVGRTVDGPLESRYEDDTLIIPVMREELVVERRWVLVEEIHVTRMRGEERRPERAHAQSERVSVYREMRPEDGRS